MEHGDPTTSCIACMADAICTPSWQPLHGSSTRNEGPFAVQTNRATSVPFQGGATEAIHPVDPDFCSETRHR